MPNSNKKQQRHPLHISLIAIVISLLFVLGACESATLPFNLVAQDSEDGAESAVEPAADSEQEGEGAVSQDADVASENNEGEEDTSAESDSGSETPLTEEANSEDTTVEDADSDESSSMLACQDEDHGDAASKKDEASDADMVNEEDSSTEENHEAVNEEVLEIVEANTALGGALANLLSQIVIRQDATNDETAPVAENAEPADSEESAEAADESGTQTADGDADTSTEESASEAASAEESENDEATAEASDEDGEQAAEGDATTGQAGDAVEAQPNLGETLAGLFSLIVIQPETADEAADAEVTEEITEEITEEAAEEVPAETIDETATTEEASSTEDSEGGEVNAEASGEDSEQVADSDTSTEGPDDADTASEEIAEEVAAETTDEAAAAEETPSTEDSDDGEESEQVADSDISTEEASDTNAASDEVAVEAQPNLGETLAGLFSLIVIQPDTADEAADGTTDEAVATEATEEVAEEVAGEDNIGMMVAGTGGPDHPLDGLTADEYQRLVDTLTAGGKADGETHFIYAGLHGPSKDFMLSWNSWDDFPRMAAALVANGDDVSMAVVDVVEGTMVSWEPAEGAMIPARADSEVTGNENTEVELVVAEDAGYTFDGNAISWHNWSFHHRFDQQAGLVLSEINYLNKGRLRSVLYQMQLEAIIGPYMGEDATSPFGTELVNGIDCPDSATYVGTLFADSTGQPYAADAMVCIFEAGNYMGTPATELVVRTAAATANHQYLVDYIFGKDGTIQGRVTLTGFDDAQFAQEGTEESAYDTLIAPHLTVINQDHYFHFRLDMDIDGTQNNFVTAKMADSGDGRWVVISTVAETEEDSVYSMNSGMPTIHQVVNPNAYSGLGHSPAYMIIETNGNVSLADSSLRTAPQSGVEGESIANTDIVVWYQMGFHHISRMEDWPAKPMYWQGFQLVPFNFFELNPSVGE